MISSKVSLTYFRLCHQRILLLSVRNYNKLITEQNLEEIQNIPAYPQEVKGAKRRKHVYMWGNTMFGAMGISNFLKPVLRKNPLESVNKPWRLPFADLHKANDVACGYGFTVFAVSNEKTTLLYGTGLNTDFQIGYHCAEENSPLEIVINPVPIPLPLLNPSTKIVKVGCGRAHTIVVTDNEGVFSLGNNSYGQCGVPSELTSKSKVFKLEGIDEVIEEVVCGQDHTLLLSLSGKVYSFGWSADGQTGAGHYDNQFTPCLLKGDIENEKIVQLSSVADTVLAVSDKGEVFGWGNSEYGQLNLATDEQQVNIPKFLDLKIGKVKYVAAGGTACGVVDDKGDVHVWGYGILGYGPHGMRSLNAVCLPITYFGANELNPHVKVEQLVCGLSHFAAITNRGHLYTWGKNKNNGLGVGKEEDQFFPAKVFVPAAVTKVSCGVDHTAVICKSFS